MGWVILLSRQDTRSDTKLHHVVQIYKFCILKVEKTNVVGNPDRKVLEILSGISKCLLWVGNRLHTHIAHIQHSWLYSIMFFAQKLHSKLNKAFHKPIKNNKIAKVVGGIYIKKWIPAPFQLLSGIHPKCINLSSDLLYSLRNKFI